jgi:hypothetical protein
MTAWALSASRATVSSEALVGKLARIQRFPSSSSGMNSRPRRGTAKNTVATIMAAKMASVTQRNFRQRASCRR